MSHTKLWALGLTLLGLLVITATYRDYGISWDEPIQSRLGEGVASYFASGGRNHEVNAIHHLRFYGPLFEFGAALLYAANPEAKYEIRHFAIAATALLTILGLLRFAQRIPERHAAVYASLALASLPRFYGHAFVNSKDIPFACAFVWTLCFLIDLGRDPRSWRRILAAGFLIGSTLSLRPGGLPLLLLMYAGVMIHAAWSRGAFETRESVRLALVSVVVWSIAWVGMISLWPWAHEAPVAHPILAIRAALAFPDTFPVLFDGHRFMSDALPRYYLAKYILITTPPLTLLLALIGMLVGIRWQRRGMRRPVALIASTLQLWFFAPLAIMAIAATNVYDGLRHVLFTLPALALFAGWGAAALLHGLSRPKLRAVAGAALALALTLPVVDLMRLHPYEMTYFNVFAGGLEGASRRYETDYWLLSYREAMEWINARARERADGKLRVIAAVDSYSYECAAHFAAPGVEVEPLSEGESARRLPKGYDYFVATTRFDLHGHFPDSPIVHLIGREGAVFTIIRGRERQGRRPAIREAPPRKRVSLRSRGEGRERDRHRA